MSRVVLDSSALLFWTLAPHRLSTAARSAIDDATAFGWMASAISLWEIGLKVQRGQLSLGVSFAEVAGQDEPIVRVRRQCRHRLAVAGVPEVEVGERP